MNFEKKLFLFNALNLLDVNIWENCIVWSSFRKSKLFFEINHPFVLLVKKLLLIFKNLPSLCAPGLPQAYSSTDAGQRGGVIKLRRSDT